jgi:hypothetical protein
LRPCRPPPDEVRLVHAQSSSLTRPAGRIASTTRSGLTAP